MTRQLDAAGFSGSAARLRRAQAARYWMAAPGPREACTRRMLLGFQAAGGTLDAGVAELAAGRAFNPQRSHHQLPPYSETEWALLASACEAAAGESFAAHKQALAAAGRGRHPREHGWSGDNLRWLLARTGPVGIVAFGEHLGCSDNVVRQRGGVLDASRDLFPGVDVVIAYRLLFGIYSGIVPDGIDDLVTGDIDWAGDSDDPAVLCQGPDRRREPEPAPPGGPAAGAVAGALGAAAQPRRPGTPQRPVAPAEQARRHQDLGEGRGGRPGRHPALDRPARGDRRRRPAAEGPPVPHPHHLPVDAGQAGLGRPRTSDHRPQPHPRKSRATTT